MHFKSIDPSEYHYTCYNIDIKLEEFLNRASKMLKIFLKVINITTVRLFVPPPPPPPPPKCAYSTGGGGRINGHLTTYTSF